MHQCAAKMCFGAAALIVAAMPAGTLAMPRADAVRVQRIVVRCALTGEIPAADQARLCDALAAAGRAHGGRPVVREAAERPRSTDLVLALDASVARSGGRRLLSGQLRTAQLRSGEDPAPAPVPLAIDIDDRFAFATIDAAVSRLLRPQALSASLGVRADYQTRTSDREE